mgnify:CR=1 FL=1
MLNTMRFEQEILPGQRSGAKAARRAATARDCRLPLRPIDEYVSVLAAKVSRHYRDDASKRIKQKVKAGESKTLAPVKVLRAKAAARSVDLMALLRKAG